MCTFLKRNIGEELFFKVAEVLQARNKTHFTLRTLAKCFYPLTDKKSFTYEKIKDAVVERIREKANILKISIKEIYTNRENKDLENITIKMEISSAGSGKTI